MKTPYGLQVIEDCLSCPVRKDRMFCDLPREALQGLDAISSPATYPKGAVLFVEGQEARGVFTVCEGRVKLFGSSANGKTMIFRIAEAGEIIGLPSTLAAKPYELTAEALEPTQASFIRRENFLEYLRAHGDAALRVAEMLSGIYYATCREVRYLGLSGSVEEKLARFLLDHKAGKAKDTIVLTLTHDDIAGMLGTTRETVSRLFTGFKRKKLIEASGATVKLDRKGLGKVAGV